MKALVHDVLSIFSAKSIEPVLVRSGLSQREKALIAPFGVTEVSWATSLEDLHDALVQKALAAGAVGYHITHVESHKPGQEAQPVLAATATLYNISDRQIVDNAAL
ncbi:DUF1471 domain-containing protein [Erwinia sp. 198]|uniref:DUF1471 domain-containing protein n=1 Tax=Erwinia sp. 198 TaxID=2022746 RepID=UPI000F66E864|nr:DUF1471 domain-containing protein [Erwinia sp. 198]RRZ95531.1 DUF1471 domain-containing protein [Erwinia sp. 198]